MRIGFGYDIHPLQEGYDLIIGGVTIPHTKGSAGHSDADALIHAICDALLGAACLGDIGTHFPDSSPEYKGIDSKILLGKVRDLVEREGYTIINLDTTICLETPRITPYVNGMKEALSKVLKINQNCISIKATTNEKMGFVGREEGIAAYAVTLIDSLS